MICPNKNSPEWKELVSKYGETEAYAIFVDAGLQIPISINRNNGTTPYKTKIIELLDTIGVKTAELKGSRFEHLGKDGIADMFSRMVYASLDGSNEVLTEEAMHFFVELLKQQKSPLYDSMANDIKRMPIYEQVFQEYKDVYDNETDIKDEAIGKLLTRHFLDGSPVAGQEGRVSRWFDEVKRWLLRLIYSTGVNKDDLESTFKNTAEQIKAGNIKGTVKPVNKTLYSLSKDAESAMSKLLDVDKRLSKQTVTVEGSDTPEEKYFITNADGTQTMIPNRVHDIIAKGKRYGNKDTARQKQELINAEEGSIAHDDMQSAIQEAITGNAGTYNSHPLVTKAIKAYAGNIVNNYKTLGAEILTEVKIYDPSRKLAGTLDFVAIFPDGSADVLDWKFIEDLANKSLDWRIDDWNTQLNTYAEMLKSNYGITKFNKIRIIPINAQYRTENNTKKMVGAVFGDGSQDSKSNLNPVPSFQEMTDNESFNGLISELTFRYNHLKANPAKDVDTKVKQEQELHEIWKTIQDIQVNRSLEEYSKLVEIDMNRMKELVKQDAHTGQDIKELHDLVDSYKDLISKGLLRDVGNTSSTGISNIQSASMYAQSIAADVESLTNQYLNSYNLNTQVPVKPIGFWAKALRLSDIDNKYFQAFYRLLNKKAGEVFGKTKSEEEEIREIINQVTKEAGRSDASVFEPLLNKKDGKKTGELIRQFRSDYYSTLHEKLEKGDVKWVKANTNFDEVAYEEARKYKEELMTKRYAGTSQAVSKVKEAMVMFEHMNDVRVSNKAYNERNRFLKPTNNWHTEEYKAVLSNPNAGLAKLYHKYQDIIAYANENCDAGINKTFLPYVKDSMLQGMLNNGFSFKNFMDNAWDSIRIDEYATSSISYDAKGNKIITPQLAFLTPTYKRNLNQQSYDLGNMLIMFTRAAYMNNAMSDMVDDSYLMLYGLKASKMYRTDVLGRPVTTGNITEPIDADTIDKFEQYMRRYLGGIELEDKDADILGTGVSAQKFMRKGLNYYSKKSLTFNIFSGLSNLFGGLGVAISTGAKNHHFTTKEMLSAMARLGGANRDEWLIAKYFGITDSQYDISSAADLSLSKVDKWINSDNALIFQRIGDSGIQNSLLIAMLRKYTLKDGKAVIKTGDEPSIHSMLTTDKDGKLVLPKGFRAGDLEFTNFRAKVRAVAGEVLGSTSEFDRQLIDNTMLGLATVQFRRWIMPMATARFGGLRYNVALDEHTMGKYKAFGAFIDKRGAGILKSFITNRDGLYTEKLQELYNKAYALNPDLTFEEFKRLHIQSMQSNIAEMAIMAAVTALVLGLKPDDDEEADATTKFAIKTLTRTSDELSFWYNINSAGAIIKSPIAISGLMTQTAGLLSNTASELYGIASDDDKLQEDNDPIKKLRKLTIGFSAYDSLMDVISTENK